MQIVYFGGDILGHYELAAYSSTDPISSWGHCRYCGQWHDLNRICSNVAEIEYYPDGTVKRVVLKQ